MGFIETSYGSNPNLSQVNIDSILNMGNYGIAASGNLNILNPMDLNTNDLIGVKQFVCEDYLGAVRAIASDNLQWTLTLTDVSSGNTSKRIRVPSNFVNNCSVKMSFYATNTNSSAGDVRIWKVGGSYFSVSIPANTTTPTEFTTTFTNINAGELYFFQPVTTYMTFYGSSGVKIKCDLNPVTSGYWDISD